MAREPITDDGEHAAKPGQVIINFTIDPELKARITHAAWSTNMSRGALMRAFLEDANFDGWLAQKTLKIRPLKVQTDG